jgi:hypothetical protein
LKTADLDLDATPKHTNRLAGETSPYLRQHAHNPVDWYPWGEEALAKARAEEHPILLSIGYSACHWCHVMAHESFEDEVSARLMNTHFVNIKVDREERPDLDKIYQIAHQMLTQRAGGWPLTMFLTHDDHVPFFGGTYFPKEPRYGMPAFKQVLERVTEYYREHQQELRAQNTALIEAFGEITPGPADAHTRLDDAPLRQARRDLGSNFDEHWGGFGGAPKFPHPTTIERLFRDWHATATSDEPDLQALYMASLTLRRMGEGGLYDQLGGGFSRYSVDKYWMIPHFEKMLYDNGSLLAVYAQAAVATGDAFYAKIARETAEWTRREMQSPEGGYYSSLDADSEGHEGKFYVWDREEIRTALTPEEHAVFSRRFGLDREPNFEGQSWHLHGFVSLEEIARERDKSRAGAGTDEAEITRLIDSARAKLLAIRNRRIWPHRDEKILTSWNALMIRGMAFAARSAAGPDASRLRARFTDSASRALDFLRHALWRNGRLLATYKDGVAHLDAYLDDYVFLADAVLEMQQVRFRADELAFMRELLEVVLAQFTDRERGGFYFVSDEHEKLMHRPKSFADDATPSGNGIAAFVLQRAGYLLGEPRYLEAAEQTLRASWQSIARYPHGHTTMLTALEEYLHAPETVILRGEPHEIERWKLELDKLYAPRRMVIAVPADATDLPAALADKRPRGAAVAYICRGSTCSAPVDSLSTLVRDLRLALQPTTTA